jgi:hypothetical protein
MAQKPELYGQHFLTGIKRSASAINGELASRATKFSRCFSGWHNNNAPQFILVRFPDTEILGRNVLLVRIWFPDQRNGMENNKEKPDSQH